jgi:hypothetical protein
MQMSDKLLSHVKNQVALVHHGRVIIEVNETSNKIDVITESRERFKPVTSDTEKK